MGTASIKDYGRMASRRVFATENVTKAKKIEEECPESYEDCPEMVFINAKNYVDRKIRMLRQDMEIEPSGDEIKHLYSLKTRGDIDRAVAGLINKAWDNF